MQGFNSSKKGISPIVATTVLVIATLVIGGVAFVSFRNQTSSLSRNTDLRVQSIDLVSTSDSGRLSLTVKNTGTTSLDNVMVELVDPYDSSSGSSVSLQSVGSSLTLASAGSSDPSWTVSSQTDWEDAKFTSNNAIASSGILKIGTYWGSWNQVWSDATEYSTTSTSFVSKTTAEYYDTSYDQYKHQAELKAESGMVWVQGRGMVTGTVYTELMYDGHSYSTYSETFSCAWLDIGMYKWFSSDGTGWMRNNKIYGRNELYYSSASWTSTWHPYAEEQVFNNITQTVDSIGGGLQVKVQCSDDGSSVKDETGWMNITSTGTITKDISGLSNATYVRVKYDLTKGSTPKVADFTVNSTTANVAPTADFDYTPSSPLTDETIDFDGTLSSDSDGNISSYEWDWTNDGTWDATGSNPSHSYPDDGSYTVELRVTDDVGATDTYSETVTVQNRSPTADFTYSITDYTVDVDASGSSDSDGIISSYEWDWTNDGTYEGSGQTDSHTYSSGGDYAIELRVTDDDDATDTVLKTVSANESPNTPTDLSPSGKITTTSPTLSADVTDPDGDTMDVTFYDASNDSVIETDTGVADGGTASVTWSGLTREDSYSFYAKSYDGFDWSSKSSTQTFTVSRRITLTLPTKNGETAAIAPGGTVSGSTTINPGIINTGESYVVTITAYRDGQVVLERTITVIAR